MSTLESRQAAGSFMRDYFTALQIWNQLTRAQKRAVRFPWKPPHPQVEARLRELGLRDDDGATRSGLAVALCHFISAEPPPHR